MNVLLYAQSLSPDWLFATPWTVACQVTLFTVFSRQEYWSGLPFPPTGGLLESGTQPALEDRFYFFFNHWTTWEAWFWPATETDIKYICHEKDEIMKALKIPNENSHSKMNMSIHLILMTSKLGYLGNSPVVQWLGLHSSTLGAQIRSLIWELRSISTVAVKRKKQGARRKDFLQWHDKLRHLGMSGWRQVHWQWEISNLAIDSRESRALWRVNGGVDYPQNWSFN